MSEDASERIVIRGVNWLGDAVMSTPALLRLREAKPSAHIALVTEAKLAGLWQAHPAINEVIPFQRSDGIGHLSKQLRQGEFQKALILPNSFRSAFEFWLAGVPERIGFSGNGRSGFLTTVMPRRREEIHLRKRTPGEIKALVRETPDKPRDRFPVSGHQFYDYLHLVTALGASASPTPPRIIVKEEEIGQFRCKHVIPDRAPIVGLNPGAEYGPAKRWPAERFVEAACLVEKAQPCAWILTGGPADAALCDQIGAGIRTKIPNAKIYNMAGRTTLRELCTALSVCDVVLTNDTGPMHVAAAARTPVFVPLGRSSPELTGPSVPGDERQRLVLGQAPCAPCFLRECPIDFRCMLSIPADRIARELLGVLNAKNVPRPST